MCAWGQYIGFQPPLWAAVHSIWQNRSPSLALNLMSTDRKVWEKSSVGWRSPAPDHLCCIFFCKPWLTAQEFSESVIQVSKYCNVDFQRGAFSVFPYLFSLEQFEEKFRSKQMAGWSGCSPQGGHTSPKWAWKQLRWLGFGGGFLFVCFFKSKEGQLTTLKAVICIIKHGVGEAD